MRKSNQKPGAKNIEQSVLNVSFRVRKKNKSQFFFLFFFFFFFGLFAFFRAAPVAHRGSQARGPIGAIATSLRQSHSNAGSEPRLQPTPQLRAMLDL